MPEYREGQRVRHVPLHQTGSILNLTPNKVLAAVQWDAPYQQGMALVRISTVKTDELEPEEVNHD